jgi:4'-phosphopantetheinyl transferase
MIQIYYAYTDIIQDTNLDSFIAQLSSKNQSKFYTYKRKEDRDLLILSSILLSMHLKDSGINEHILSDMQYSAEGRPYFAGASFDFSVSHTENCAIVAFSENQRLGIDIEKIKDVDFLHFKNIFSKDEWDQINTSNNKTTAFYSFWTLLESAIKADGRGLSLITSDKILIKNNQVFINGKQWFSEHKNFDPSISCCITSDKKIEAINLKEVHHPSN